MSAFALDPKYTAYVAELSMLLLAHLMRTDDPQVNAFEAVLATQ